MWSVKLSAKIMKCIYNANEPQKKKKNKIK